HGFGGTAKPFTDARCRTGIQTDIDRSRNWHSGFPRDDALSRELALRRQTQRPFDIYHCLVAAHCVGGHCELPSRPPGDEGRSHGRAEKRVMEESHESLEPVIEPT